MTARLHHVDIGGYKYMVRATFAGFSTALSALQANQKRLDIVGQNLSNMNTVGYTRQQLETSSLNYTTPVSNYMNGSEVIVGFGVHMNKVSQIRDPYLDAQYRSQMYRSGYTDSLQTSLDSLSKIFDESSIDGIRSAFDDIQAILIDMQDGPKVNDAIYESELRSKMKALTNLLNTADTQITEAERQEYMRLTGEDTTDNGAVQTINDLLMQIGNLNRQIKKNQTLGQQSLELMDERNVLLDELSSYIPIEVTYYKDQAHDGVDAGGNTDTDAAKAEMYHLDSNGNVIAKKEWPDDVRVEMLYVDDQGVTKRLTLVEGTEGTGDENIGKLSLIKTGEPPYPNNFSLTFEGSPKNLVNGNSASFILAIDPATGTMGKTQLPDESGSLQSMLDMLWKDGSADAINSVRGYEYYRHELDHLAQAFADVMNAINIDGAINDDRYKGKAETQFLIANKTVDNKTAAAKNGITAANISINTEWINGNVHVSTAGSDANGTKNPTDTILNMLQAMGATYPVRDSGNIAKILKAQYGNAADQEQVKKMNNLSNLKDNSFADFMNHTSTTLANDSYHNTYALKTNVTVLNGIQNSRDSISGVSLDEEASNMMQFMSAYNAASRFMTALDQTLDVLINSTGVVGR